MVLGYDRSIVGTEAVHGMHMVTFMNRYSLYLLMLWFTASCNFVTNNSFRGKQINQPQDQAVLCETQ